GLTPADLEAAEVLRHARAPVLVAVNKADNERRELEGAEFHELGWGELYAISALHGRGTGDLLDGLVAALPPESETELERKRLERETDSQGVEAAGGLEAGSEKDRRERAEFELDEETMLPSPEEAAWEAQVAADEARRSVRVRVAIVGRPNVGKSSLLNALLGEERAIVSEVPGTTRDAVDTALDWSGQPVLLIDTAGMRRRGKVASGAPAERFSALRALKGISRADVAILVLDATDGLTAQDAHVAGYVIEEGKGLVVAINKWDLVEKDGRTFDEYARRIRQNAPFLDFAPIIAISARTGQRVPRVMEAALEIAGERLRRVPTGELNRMLSEATFRQPPPPVKGRRPKLYYATQAAVGPPTFVVFTSDAASVHFSYQRYLENQLRQAFGFAGTPIRLAFRNRTRVQLERRKQTRSIRAAAGTGAGRRGASPRGRRTTPGGSGKRPR
ncbi:MAG: ribosome biogenesis GTPase Der, partial [Chloroflexota bacterium]|nr:ribosome biogenesis GTPase Der [Chloroflexota bacterium]